MVRWLRLHAGALKEKKKNHQRNEVGAQPPKRVVVEVHGLWRICLSWLALSLPLSLSSIKHVFSLLATSPRNLGVWPTALAPTSSESNFAHARTPWIIPWLLFWAVVGESRTIPAVTCLFLHTVHYSVRSDARPSILVHGVIHRCLLTVRSS